MKTTKLTFRLLLKDNKKICNYLTFYGLELIYKKEPKIGGDSFIHQYFFDLCPIPKIRDV